MSDTWFQGVADELARALVAARACAEASEELLESLRDGADPSLRDAALDALVAPAAICRVLLDVIDDPPQLVLAAAKLCRESTTRAAERLEPLRGRLDVDGVVAALRGTAESCGALLAATS